MESAGGQEAMGDGGKGFEGCRIVVQKVDDRVGEFGSKGSQRHSASGVRTLERQQVRGSDPEGFYGNQSGR